MHLVSDEKELSQALDLRDACRDSIDYEGGLINSRISWLVGSQAFLLGTYALLLNAPHMHMVGGLPTSAPLPGQSPTTLPGQLVSYSPSALYEHIQILRFWFQFTGVTLSLITTVAVLAGYRAIISHTEKYYWSVHRHLGQITRSLVPFPMAGRSRRVWGMGSTVIGPLFVLVWLGLSLPSHLTPVMSTLGALLLIALWLIFALRFSHTNEVSGESHSLVWKNKIRSLWSGNVVLICGTSSSKLGRPVAERLMANGFEVCYFDGRKNRPFRDFDGKVRDLNNQQLRNMRAVLFFVPRDQEVEQNLTAILSYTQRAANAAGGLLSSSVPLVVHSTISKQFAEKMQKIAKDFCNPLIEMPVTGGVSYASGEIDLRTGLRTKLACFSFGSEKALKQASDVLGVYTDQSARIDFEAPGEPAMAKSCNQVCLANNLVGAAEALSLAERLGLNPDMVLQGITSGAAHSYSLEKHAPLMISRGFDKGILAKNLSKDIGYALDSISDPGVFKGAQYARTLLDQVPAAETTPAIVQLYKQTQAPTPALQKKP
ncbi:6-phosphogluconate dehydrogenase, NADP-binding [Fimbriimonadaceae bacterium]